MLCGIVQNEQIIFLGAIDANYSKNAENEMSLEIYAATMSIIWVLPLIFF